MNRNAFPERSAWKDTGFTSPSSSQHSPSGISIITALLRISLTWRQINSCCQGVTSDTTVLWVVWLAGRRIPMNGCLSECQRGVTLSVRMPTRRHSKSRHPFSTQRRHAFISTNALTMLAPSAVERTPWKKCMYTNPVLLMYVIKAC